LAEQDRAKSAANDEHEKAGNLPYPLLSNRDWEPEQEPIQADCRDNQEDNPSSETS
jgi:hypothetical protein